MGVLDDPTKPLLNTPFKNPETGELTEIEVTDRIHPLFGRKFTLVSLSNPAQGIGHAMVVYQDHMCLKIPLSATHLAMPRQSLGTKLTFESVTELVTVFQQYEASNAHPTPSGLESSDTRTPNQHPQGVKRHLSGGH